MRTGSVFVDVYYVVTNNSARLYSARVVKVETIEFSKDEASKKKEKGHWQDDAVEGLNVINGPKCNKVLYYICTEIYCKMNMSNKNDALQSTRNLIGCTIFLTSEKYRMTNHNPQTKVFTSDKNRIDFPAFH